MYKEPKCDYEKYDGIAHEERRQVWKKSQKEGPKWRNGWGYATVSDSDWQRIFGKKGSK